MLPVRNIPKFKDRANWSRDTFQPTNQQTNKQNIAPVIKKPNVRQFVGLCCKWLNPNN